MSFPDIKNKNQGFTIVELLIVVVVIAILAAITIVSYNGITNRANASVAKSMASGFEKKIHLFVADGPTGTYPRAWADLTGGPSGTSTIRGVTGRPTTKNDSWHVPYGSIQSAVTSDPTASNGKTTLVYRICGQGDTPNAPINTSGLVTLTGVEIRYFDYEAGSGTKSITIGNATPGGDVYVRACFNV